MRANIVVAVFMVGFVSGLLASGQKPASPGLPAERVTGIGGVFFKARDPKALSVWYRDKLGLAVTDGAPFARFEWREREDSGRIGTTAWSLFRSDRRTSRRVKRPSWSTTAFVTSIGCWPSYVRWA